MTVEGVRESPENPDAKVYRRILMQLVDDFVDEDHRAFNALEQLSSEEKAALCKELIAKAGPVIAATEDGEMVAGSAERFFLLALRLGQCPDDVRQLYLQKSLLASQMFALEPLSGLTIEREIDILVKRGIAKLEERQSLLTKYQLRDLLQ